MSKNLAAQFKKAEDRLHEAQLEYDRVRGEYFLDRRRRASRGEDLEPLTCADQTAWSDQLYREQVARENAEKDREAGLLA